MKKSIIYLVIFVAIQLTVTFAVQLGMKLIGGGTGDDNTITQLLLVSGISSALTILLFLALKWCPVDRHFFKGNGWKAIAMMILTVVLAIGIIVPLALLEELIPESWTIDLMGNQLVEMLKTREGYFIVCMLAPLAEEVVFRGAMIRALQQWITDKYPTDGDMTWSHLTIKKWLPVIISAFFFAAVHMNPAQIPHALIVGCLLGWLYVRTNSILPGFILHCINNSVAYLLVMLFPHIPMDANVEAYFGGNIMAVVQAVVSSLMIIIPTLYLMNKIKD